MGCISRILLTKLIFINSRMYTNGSLQPEGLKRSKTRERIVWVAGCIWILYEQSLVNIYNIVNKSCFTILMWIYTRNVPRSMFNFSLEIQTSLKNQALSHFQDEKKSPYFKCSSPNRFRWLYLPFTNYSFVPNQGGGSGGGDRVCKSNRTVFISL